MEKNNKFKNIEKIFNTKIIKSNYCELHHIELNDAQLVFELRTKRKDNFLKKTYGTVEDQKIYLQNYLKKFDLKKEIYYKIYDPISTKFVGVLRLTNLEMEKTFSWESYVVAEDCRPIVTLDAMITVYRLGFEYLKRLKCGPWAVYRDNIRVNKLHEVIGMAKIVDENQEYIYHSIEKEQYDAKIDKFLKLKIGNYMV